MIFPDFVFNNPNYYIHHLCIEQIVSCVIYIYIYRLSLFQAFVITFYLLIDENLLMVYSVLLYVSLSVCKTNYDKLN